MTDYQHAKQALKEIAKQAKSEYKGDKAAVRQIINDNAHNIAEENGLSEYATDLLHNYACNLHPKN